MPGGKIVPFPLTGAKTKQKSKKANGSADVVVSREAVFSFLKDTRGVVTWTAADLARTLRVSVAQTKQALPILEMQGYIRAAEHDEWMTTIAGEQISGSAAPRFGKVAVDRALNELRDRIRQLNKDSKSDFTVSKAVAFGDFLGNASRVQAADVGIQLKQRAGRKIGAVDSAKVEKLLFTALRTRSAMLHLQRYADWMAARTHRRLM